MDAFHAVFKNTKAASKAYFSQLKPSRVYTETPFALILSTKQDPYLGTLGLYYSSSYLKPVFQVSQSKREPNKNDAFFVLIFSAWLVFLSECLREGGSGRNDEEMAPTA